MPAAGQAEKSGSFTNTQRLIQWHKKAVEPSGDSRSETWFTYHLGRLLKEKAAREPSSRNAALNALTWDLPTHGEVAEPDAEAVLREVNGYHWQSKEVLQNYEELKADGSTACGCWIYSGIMPQAGKNIANMRESKDPLGHGWGFAWPKDTRILYNRASARPDGTPWSERKKLVWWDPEKCEWTGHDNSDFKKTMPPNHKGEPEKGGLEALDGDKRSDCTPMVAAGFMSAAD
jgi:formate dehydrogenase major subunit